MPSQNPFDERRSRDMTERFRQALSTKRMNQLTRLSLEQREAQVYPHLDRDYGTPIMNYSASSSTLSSRTSLRNLPLMPQPVTDNRSARFRTILTSLSSMPCKWENPGLLDEALKVVPLQQIYNEAEEESQILRAEAESLGQSVMPAWGYQDCVIRALLRWFKASFFTWINNPPCSACGHPTIGLGRAAPQAEEQARGANQVELYRCSYEQCLQYERFPRYSDAFVLLQTRRGRVGEWANCFGMLCRAMGSRVRWVWNSEDHVWIEVYSLHRKRWIHVDVCEQAWDKPKIYTEGWQRKLGYCIAFSADGATDVTRRYIRNYTKWAGERTRAPEPVLLSILAEIRDLRRRNLPKNEKFRLEGEDMRESKELRHYVAQAIAAEVVGIVPGVYYVPPPPTPQNATTTTTPPPSTQQSTARPDPDGAKAAEARSEGQQRLQDRQRERDGLDNAASRNSPGGRDGFLPPR